MVIDQTLESDKTLDCPASENQTTNSNYVLDQLEKQQQPKPTRLKRPISQKACETCRKRRVRCNASARNWPQQKCTNCEEFGVECIVLKKRRKRSKEEIEADILRQRCFEQQQQQQQGKDGKHTVGLSIKFETPEKLQKKRKLKKTATTNTKESKKPMRRLVNVKESSQLRPQPQTLKEQHIIIDPETILKRQLDPACHAAILHGYSQKPELMKMRNFDKLKPQRLTMRDIITPEQLTVFNINECFILPDESTCRKYIDSYFEYYESTYPVLSRLQFEKDFTDLRDPPSLLFLWTMIYVGSAMSIKTPEQRRLSRTYYERGRLLSDASFESHAIYYVLSVFILIFSPPGVPQTTLGFCERTRHTIQIAIAFGMNTDPQYIPYLKDEERYAYKRLFWQIVGRDRYFAVCLSRSFYLSDSAYSLPKLKLEDFADMDPQEAERCYRKAKFADMLHTFMTDLNRIQKSANIAYFNDKPFRHYQIEADKICANMKQQIIGMFKSPSESYMSFLAFLIYYTIETYILRVNVYRFHYLVLRYLKLEQATPGIHETYVFPETEEDADSIDYWDKLVISIHNINDTFLTCFPIFKDRMIFSQISLFIGYELCMFSIFFTYCEDQKFSQMMKDDIKRLYPLLENNLGMVSLGMTELTFGFIKRLLEDQPFRASFMRCFAIFKNHAIMLRTAYRIPKLKRYAIKAMHLFPSIYTQSHDGWYQGILYINRKEEVQPQPCNGNIAQVDSVTDCVHSDTSPWLLSTTSTASIATSNDDIQQCSSCTDDIRIRIHKIHETAKDEETKIPAKTCNLSPPAHVVPSINSIINHSMPRIPSVDTSSTDHSSINGVPPCNIERPFSRALEQQQVWDNTYKYENLASNTYQTNASLTTKAPISTSANPPLNPQISPTTTMFSCTGERENFNLYGGTNMLQEAESLFGENIESLFEAWDSSNPDRDLE
ncbi:unnamed protein product [Ambrosiozyma monospora]|uniref:Unnamed protein product n=1 Tax=Ambrosiozyma monospora TaxID=43982 RepID=A0A9W7DHM9_AMBMO|nr:unnamed protein product [Ambrosiozyma monospora]